MLGPGPPGVEDRSGDRDPAAVIDAVETPRLWLRPSDPAAAAEVNAAICESLGELRKWMPWADHAPSIEETRGHLAGKTEPGFTVWHKASGLAIGACGLHQRDAGEGRLEIGYWVRTSHTRQGFATEAVDALAAAAINAFDLTGITLKCSERNIASQKVAERAGFEHEAILDDGRVDPDGFASRTSLYLRRA